MESFSKATDSSMGINLVYDSSKIATEPILKSSPGQTAVRGLTRLVGSVTSNIERWVQEERSYGITGVGILLSFFFIFISIGLYIGLKFQKSRFEVMGRSFSIAGAAQINDGGRVVYVPVYEEIKK